MGGLDALERAGFAGSCATGIQRALEDDELGSD
jgi:hypothetical protein